MKFATAKKRATRAPVNPPPLSEADALRHTRNLAKQDAVRILWDARETLTPESLAAIIVGHAIDHVITPEAWS